MHEVVSDPIDFEKLFVTTNLTNRAVIDTALIEALRTLKEYYTPAFPEEGGRFVQPNVEALEERNRMEIQVDDAAQCVRKWMLGK